MFWLSNTVALFVTLMSRFVVKLFIQVILNLLCFLMHGHKSCNKLVTGKFCPPPCMISRPQWHLHLNTSVSCALIIGKVYNFNQRNLPAIEFPFDLNELDDNWMHDEVQLPFLNHLFQLWKNTFTFFTLWGVCLSAFLLVHLFVCLWVCLPACQPISLSSRVFVFLQLLVCIIDCIWELGLSEFDITQIYSDSNLIQLPFFLWYGHWHIGIRNLQ